MKILRNLIAVGCALALLPASLTPAHAAPTTDPALRHLPAGFDMQAHRGGRGENLESSLNAFRHAIKLGVTTLELDISLTKDGVPVVWHDLTLQKKKCRDTKPVTPNDPLYPYAGKPLGMLTWQQAQTVRCDKRLEDHPQQKANPGNKLITLPQVFQLAKRMKANRIYFNIETKTLPLINSNAEADNYVYTILRECKKAGVLERVTIQSFDWRTLALVRKLNRSIPTSMLFNVSNLNFNPVSPMMGPVDYAATGGDPILAAKQLQAQIISPHYGSADKLTADREFCQRAHRNGLRVVPYTVNDEAAMRAQIRAGADGYITDYPTLGMKVARQEKKIR